MNSNPICPYCKTPFDSFPYRKRKCEFCGNPIFIRHSLLDKTLLIVTKEEANKIDVEWNRRNQSARDKKRIEIAESLQKSRKGSLLGYKSMGVKTVRILSAGNSSCSKCSELNGKIFTIDEALEQMPIPVRNCDNVYGYCRCLYFPIKEM